MRTSWTLGLAAGAALIGGGAWAAPAFEVRDAAARVVVIPENRTDVKVEFSALNPALPLTVRNELGRVIVEGGLRHRIDGCAAEFGKITVQVGDLGQVSYDNLPQIVVHTPMDAHVEASGAVFGSVGRADALELSNAGCGDWTVANVKGELKINQAGSGDTRAGSAGELVVHAAGNGDVMVKDVHGGATLAMVGSTDVTVGSISGPLRASMAGSGDVKIAHGHATEMVVHIAGTGDVHFGGVADSLDASMAGSGDVNVAKVTGPVKKVIFGSGDVNIGRQSSDAGD